MSAKPLRRLQLMRRRIDYKYLIFQGKIKEARGRAPRLLESYLFFLAVLRRAVDFFAIVFLAGFLAVFRFAGFFFAAAIVHPSFRAGWL
ncbi:MAG TPA: hypothetical protein VNO69_04430 [Methyloceanibacter sp.]|nr:hypothetical protein [Methyloceanibacter sp.]